MVVVSVMVFFFFPRREVGIRLLLLSGLVELAGGMGGDGSEMCGAAEGRRHFL